MRTFKIKTMLAVLAFFAQKSAAQGPFLFPKDSVSWTSHYLQGYQGINDIFEIWETTMLGDTVIGGFEWSILTDRRRCRCLCPSASPTQNWTSSPVSPPQTFFLRADGPKIYLRNAAGAESLRYDFSLSVDDSIWIQNAQFVVEKTALDAMGRKTLDLRAGNGPAQRLDRWIEGVGSLNGPVAQVFQSSGLQAYFAEGCFSPQLPSSCQTPCAPTVSSTEPEPFSAIKCSPNPVFDFFELDFEKDEPIALAVFSADGRLVFEKNGVRKGQPFDASRLPSGLFFIVARAENGTTWTERFLKN